MNSPSEQLTSIYDMPGSDSTRGGKDICERLNQRAQAKTKQFVGVCIFAVSLVCVGVTAPADSRMDALWAPVRGSSTLMVGTPMVDSHGVKYYPVRSAYQGEKTQVVRILEPTHPAPGKPRRLLYVLPVEAGVDRLTSTWSDGLEELRLLDVPNRFNMTLIAPSFNYEPWYGDNVTDPTHRMESFIVKDLVPFGDSFAHDSHPERLLVGFSKSGNGVLLLILRNPRVFTAAAAWDSPAQLNKLSGFSALPMNFGTQANFDQSFIPALVTENGNAFRGRTRLWISGDQSIFTANMVQLHNQLMAASIPHVWVTGSTRVHNWHSGWLINAIEGLDAMTAGAPPAGRLQ